MNWKNWKFDLFRNWPIIGEEIQRDHYNKVLAEIEGVRKRFNHPKVTLTDSIHCLYDCLKGLDIRLYDDFSWYPNVGISAYTKTSQEATALLRMILTGGIPRYDEYFKELYAVDHETGFLDWYSNPESTDELLGQFMLILDLYCEDNPKDDEYGERYKFEYQRKELKPSLLDFFSSRYFRLVLDDFITLVRLAIHTQLRRLNGEVQQNP